MYYNSSRILWTGQDMSKVQSVEGVKSVQGF